MEPFMTELIQECLGTNCSPVKNNNFDGSGGHAAAIIAVNRQENYWIIKNAWGTDQFGNSCNSFVKMLIDTEILNYIDIFFYVEDLTRDETKFYEDYKQEMEADQKFMCIV